MADQVAEEGGELIMTLAERLREEGIEKNRREMAKRILRMGISPEQVAEASELPFKEILELKKEIDN